MHVPSKEEIYFKNILRIKWSGTEVGRRKAFTRTSTHNSIIIFLVIHIIISDGLTVTDLAGIFQSALLTEERVTRLSITVLL